MKNRIHQKLRDSVLFFKHFCFFKFSDSIKIQNNINNSFVVVHFTFNKRHTIFFMSQNKLPFYIRIFLIQSYYLKQILCFDKCTVLWMRKLRVEKKIQSFIKRILIYSNFHKIYNMHLKFKTSFQGNAQWYSFGFKKKYGTRVVLSMIGSTEFWKHNVWLISESLWMTFLSFWIIYWHLGNIWYVTSRKWSVDVV